MGGAENAFLSLPASLHQHPPAPSHPRSRLNPHPLRPKLKHLPRPSTRGIIPQKPSLTLRTDYLHCRNQIIRRLNHQRNRQRGLRAAPSLSQPFDLFGRRVSEGSDDAGSQHEDYPDDRQPIIEFQNALLKRYPHQRMVPRRQRWGPPQTLRPLSQNREGVPRWLEERSQNLQKIHRTGDHTEAGESRREDYVPHLIFFHGKTTNYHNQRDSTQRNTIERKIAQINGSTPPDFLTTIFCSFFAGTSTTS